MIQNSILKKICNRFFLLFKSLLSKTQVSLLLLAVIIITGNTITAQTPLGLPEIICPMDILVNSGDQCGGATNIDLGTPTITNNSPITGNALDFEGFENGITVPDFTPLLLQTFQVTISAWINPRIENIGIPELSFLQDVLQLNKWQHIALTFDAQTLKVYHNGVFLGSVMLNVPLLNLLEVDVDADVDVDSNISFEALKQILVDNFPFTTLGGTLDELHVWNIIRSQEEIQNDMNNEISAQPGLIALYHFNQGIAGGNNSGVTTAIDDSGNGFDITLNDFTLTGQTSNWVEGKTFSGLTISNDAPTEYNPIIFDLGDESQATITVNGANTAVFPVGDTIITWTASDSDGNTISCTQTITVAVDETTWTGNINSDWDNAGNWQDASAPGFMLSSSVTIPTGLINYPILLPGQNLNIRECSMITIDSGASLTVNPNAVVNNDGTVTNNGTLTFESDATGSAYIGTGSGSFIGDATIERFIPAKRAFRFLSSPVTTNDFISNNWQLGTHITGSSSGANGFDATVTGNPSMFSYNNVNQTWNAVPNTNATNLTSGTPYRLLVRGDRTIDLNNNAPDPTPTTLVSKGELTTENDGSSTVVLNESAGGFSFIGNPFQAQIDLQSVLNNNTTNVNPNFYWAWDPNLNVRGAYTTVFLSLGISTGGSAANNQLQAGQACFVSTINAGSASLTFDQSSKVTSEVETKVFRASGKKSVNASNSSGQLNLKLYERNAYTSNGAEADGIWILFDDNGNNDIDIYDAINFTNLDENFATKNGNTLLSIENRATPTDVDEILLEINTYRNTNYTIVANANALQGDSPILVDTYLNISTEIPQSGIIAYDFSIDSEIPESFVGDRFKIIFQNNSTLSTENVELSKIMMYPNPSKTGDFYLNIPQSIDDLQVDIYNALGAKVFQAKGLTSGKKVSFGNNFSKSNGVYFVKLTSKGLTTTKKLIIN